MTEEWNADDQVLLQRGEEEKNKYLYLIAVELEKRNVSSGGGESIIISANNLILLTI